MKLKVLLALVFVLVQVAGAQRYRITDLGSLEPVAINTWGEIAGNLNNNHAFVRTIWGGVFDLGLLPGGTFSKAAKINDLGEITGSADGPATMVDDVDSTKTASCTSMIQPFLWSPRKGLTTPATIPIVPGLWRDATGEWQEICNWGFYAKDLNNQGRVVGSNDRQKDTYLNGFLWNGAQSFDIVADGWQANTNAINNSGVMAGRTIPGGYRSVAIRLVNGVETILGGLYAQRECSEAKSVNDRGQIVGWSTTEDSLCYELSQSQDIVHAFLWEEGKGMEDLGTLPGDKFSVAQRISPSGIVIGNSGNTLVADPVFSLAIQVTGHPFIWSKRKGIEDLTELVDHRGSWELNSVADINQWGQIVGTGTRGGKTRGFLLTPEF